MTLFRKSYFYIVFALIMLFLLNMRVEAFYDTTPNYPIWLQHIADDFEVEVDILVPLYNAGMSYGQIKEKMFEAARVEDVLPETSDYIALAAEKGIDRRDAVRAYELGIKYKKDPAWLADLYKEHKDWDDISSSLNRYVQIKEAVASVSSGGFNGASALQAVGYVYSDLSSSLISQIFNVVSNVEDLEDILFFYDLNKGEDTGFLSSIFVSFDRDYADMVLEMEEVTGLRTKWPPVSFSAEDLTVPNQATQRSLSSSSFSFDEPEPQQFVLRSLDAEPESEVNAYSTTTTSSSQEGIVDMGIVYGADRNSPFKSYFSGSSESIDALTGELTVVQTDFTLPGKYGMDFEFTRVYRSSLSYLDGPSTGVNISGYSVNGGSVKQSKSYRQEASDGSVTLDTYHQEYTYSPQTSTNGMAVGDLTETLTRSEGYVDQYGVDHYQSTQQVSQETYQDVLVYPSPSDITAQYATTYSAINEYAQYMNYMYTCFGFGAGWSLDIPMMEIQTDNKFVHLGVEGTYKVGEDGYLDGRNLKDIKVQSDTSYTYDGATSAYSMTQADGTVWYFNTKGKPLAVKDKYNSYMRYYYVTDGYMKGYIDRIVDTVGRVIKFTYTGKYGYIMTDTLTWYFPQSIEVSVYESENALSQPLFSWNYNTARTSDYTPYLSSVQPPVGSPIEFNYTANEGGFSCDYYAGSFHSGDSMYYALLTSIKHPNGSVSNYTYKSRLEYRGEGRGMVKRDFFKVTDRYDTVPTEIVTASGATVQNKEENRATFTYAEPTTSNQYYVNTKTVQRISGETGMTPATETFKFNLESRLVEHEKKTPNGGENLNQTETVKTTYEYDFDRKSLPIKQTVSTKVNNVTSTKVHRYIWDDYGNQVRYIDPAGHITDYEYDYTYNMMTKKSEYMTPNVRTGEYKLTENILDSDKKKIVTVKESMVTQSSLTQGTVEGPIGEVNRNDSVIFSPDKLIKSFTMKIRLHVTWTTLYVSYKVSYRKIGTENWVVVDSGQIEFLKNTSPQIKTISLTFPEESHYEIKVEKTDLGICEIQEFKVYYDESVPLNVSQVIKTVEYDTNHPGNITAINVHQLYTGSPTSSLPSVESMTTYQYDSTWHADLVEEATVVTDVDGIQSTVKSMPQYDRLGRPTVITNQETGDLSISQTSIEYDQLGRVTKVTNPPHDNTLATTYRTYTYLDSQRKIRITDELGNVTEETYDGMDRLVTSSWMDSSNQTHVLSHKIYDSLGNLISSFDANFNETKYEYDAFGRQVKTIWPDETYKTILYSDVWVPSPNVVPSLSFVRPSHITGLELSSWIKSVNEDGDIVYNSYDQLGRLTVTASKPDVAPANGALSWDICWYEYDRFNRLVKMSVQRQANVWDTTTYGYDYVFGSPSSVDMPGNTEFKHIYEYNSLGLKVKEYSGSNITPINYQYDELGRLKKVEYPENITAKYSYDKFGNVKSASLLKNNVVESMLTIQYNKRNWIQSQQWTIGTNNYMISYEYDAVGNRKKVIYPDQESISFEYDELGHIVKIPGLFESQPTSSAGGAGFVYDSVGNLIKTYTSNGIDTVYSYNTRNKVVGISSTPLTLSYAYTGAGNVSSVTDSSLNVSPVTLNYTYDTVGQLKTAQVVRDGVTQTLKYSYDGANNRISEELVNGSSQVVQNYQYSYLPGNYINSKVGQTTVNYSWGDWGQLTSKSTGEQYIYDSTRSLVSICDSGNALASYKYDALGNRIMITEGNTITTILSCGNDAVYEIIQESGSATVTSKYVVVNGKHLAKIVKEGNGATQKYFHHVDLTGSVRAVTNASGSVVKRYDYDPFGTVSKSSGNEVETHQFTGKRSDLGTGLTYFGSRYYDSDLGRFITSDPARWGTNWYVYCYNNPLAYVDPDGMKPSDSSKVLSQSKYSTQYDVDRAAKNGFIIVGGVIATFYTGDYKFPFHVIGITGSGALAIENHYDSLKGDSSEQYVVDRLQLTRFLDEASSERDKLPQKISRLEETILNMSKYGSVDDSFRDLAQELYWDACSELERLNREIAANEAALEQTREEAYWKWTGR